MPVEAGLGPRGDLTAFFAVKEVRQLVVAVDDEGTNEGGKKRPLVAMWV
jgi:hypothetical protein